MGEPTQDMMDEAVRLRSRAAEEEAGVVLNKDDQNPSKYCRGKLTKDMPERSALERLASLITPYTRYRQLSEEMRKSVCKAVARLANEALNTEEGHDRTRTGTD